MEQGADDRVLRAARLVMAGVGVANILSAAGFAVAGLLSLPFHDVIARHLHAKYGAGLDADAVIGGLRLLFVLGLGACAVVRVMVSRLSGIIATVREGDPFAAANARRLEGVGWALLGWQLLDLGFGAVVGWFDRLGVDHAGWAPAISGWVMVLLVFVLARVFRLGAAMRDELEATV